jgi:MerR family transcriptional regulator/heat shock protein HspR
MFREFQEKEPIYPIRKAAKMLNISIHTLRMYEKENLIIPYKKSTNHRLYSQSDIERIRCIRSAINGAKISINGIKTIYSMIPCWEIINCSSEDRNRCPAFLEHNEPCWSLKGEDTICAGMNCRECSVYQNFGECGSIKEFIKQMKK